CDHGDGDQDRTRDDEERQQTGLHVPHVCPGETNLEDGPADEQQQDRLRILPHSSTNPTQTETSTATTKVAGANRMANRDPNVPASIANSLTSIMGPTTRNASRAVSEN